ncbi:MAG TPA: arginyltransferase [Polyangiaceae bacterium]|jgi:arginine-tRNA-protein transferase|nr:arginyltransferase [Polyangiaceae bacterium]
MARLLQQIIEEPRECSYLPDRCASLEHRIMLDMPAQELEPMLARGWRRFGPDYFRPACGACSACVPIRVPTASFKPSKSQRRALRSASGLRAVIGPPRIDDERLDLYHRWHSFRESAREWAPANIDRESYYLSFAFPHPAVREIAYYDELAGKRRKLVGVGICDETPNAWSAVYFYYDPTYARRSPGIANVAFQMKLAATRKRAHVYLGYLVGGCASMQYKGGFRPNERLVGWPEPDEEPEWRLVPESPGEL